MILKDGTLRVADVRSYKLIGKISATNMRKSTKTQASVNPKLYIISN